MSTTDNYEMRLRWAYDNGYEIPVFDVERKELFYRFLNGQVDVLTFQAVWDGMDERS